MVIDAELYEEVVVPFNAADRQRLHERQAGFDVGRWFGRPGDQLWVGAAPRNAEDYRELRRASGVTHILNVADDPEAWTIGEAPYDVKYRRVPVVDDGRLPPDEWFAEATDWAMAALRDPDAVVYVHCLVGSARGPAIAYAIMRRQGISRRVAAFSVRRARPTGSHFYMEDAEDWIVRTYTP